MADLIGGRERRPVQDKERWACEELRKLRAEGDKLEAEVRRIRLMDGLDVLKLIVMTFGGIFAGLPAASSLGWM